jgi:hypothetical protein
VSFDQLAEAETVRLQARRIIDSLNGIAALLLEPSQPIRPARLEQVKPSGSPNSASRLGPATVRIRGGLSHIVIGESQGRMKEPRCTAEPASDWLAASISSEHVSRALSLRAKGKLDRQDLSQMFDLIEEGAGGAGAIVGDMWASYDSIGEFRDAISHAGLVGSSNDQGARSTRTPRATMDIRHARLFMDRLLTNWLNSS